MRLRTTLPLLVPAVLSLTAAAHAQTAVKKTVPKKPVKSVSGPVNVATGKKTWALLVGISKYGSSQIASLTYPADDVTAVSQALEDPTLGNVPADHVKLLTNDQATRDNIMGAVDTFFKPNVKPGDTIIVFLAGHGVAKGYGPASKGYLLPYDVHGLTTAALDSSAVNLRDFSTAIGQLPAVQFIAFVDACREDPTPGRGVAGNPMSDVVQDSMQITPDAPASTTSTAHVNSVTFFACSVGQRAYEDPNYQHGVFTYYILDGIKNAAVPQPPDGAIDMGRLATSVTEGVTGWAKQQSSSGDFEVDQTPQIVPATYNTGGLTLMDVTRPYPDTPIAAAPPTVNVSTYPDDAQVSVDGQTVGSGSIEEALSGPGQHTVSAQAPGYAPFQKTFNAIPGYPDVVNLTLPPAARGVTDPGSATPDTAVPASYTQSQADETAGETQEAEAGYGITINANPTFGPAYESLAALERKDGQTGKYVGTLVDMNGQTTPTAHSLALLAEAYADYCVHGPSLSTGDCGGHKGSKDYPFPKSQKDAGDLGVKAAKAAVALDANSAEAERSLGFALVAQDVKLKDFDDPKTAFSSASFMDVKDPENHYGLGYCNRVYAQMIKDKDAKSAQLQQAITELNQAVAIRPQYYEAHLELAYCYHMMDDNTPATKDDHDNAEKEYQLAQANRTQATDGNEFAGTDVAMSALYEQDSKNTSDPDKKQQYSNASDGEISDAKEITPDLKQALTMLRTVGLSSNIEDYLPDSVRNLIDWKSTLQDQVNSHVHGLLGGFGGGL